MKIRSKLQAIIGLMATLIQDSVWTITGIILIFTLCPFTSSAYPLAKIEIPEKYEYLNVVEDGTLQLEKGMEGNYCLESYRALSPSSEDVGSQFFKTANTCKTEEYCLGPFEMVVNKGWKYTVDAVWIYTGADKKRHIPGITYAKIADDNIIHYDDRLVDVQISGNEGLRTVSILIKGPLTKQILADPAIDPNLQDLLTGLPRRRTN